MKKIVTFSFTTTAILGLLKIFSIVPFNRFAADDFGYVNPALLNGFWQAQRSAYLTWTGRFTSTFLQSLFGVLVSGEGRPIVYSLITFAVLLLAFAVFYSRFLSLKITDFKVLLFSCVSFVTLYIVTPNKSESWYWMTGSITYLWPIIFLTFGLSALFIKKVRKIDYILSFLFVFLATAGNETFGLSSFIVLAGLLIYSILTKHLNKLLLTMSVAAAISFGLVYLSPGNAVRAIGGGSDQMSWFGSFAYAVQTGPSYLCSLIVRNILFLTSLLIVFSYFFSIIFAKTDIKNSLDDILKKMFIVLATPVFISILYLFPAFRILGRIPPDRSDLTLAFVTLVSVIALAYCLSRVFSIERVRRSIIFEIVIFSSAFLLFISSFTFVSTLASDIYIAKNYSTAYDNLDFQLKKASDSGSKKDVVVAKLPDSGLVTPMQLQYQWVRVAVSNYYKVSGIVVK